MQDQALKVLLSEGAVKIIKSSMSKFKVGLHATHDPWCALIYDW